MSGYARANDLGKPHRLGAALTRPTRALESARMDAKARLTPLDRPNSYVGRTLSRVGARRAVAGRGTYTDDMSLPRMLHAAFVRSPHAHARIVRIEPGAAGCAPGVVRVMTGAEVAKMCTAPWVGTLTCFFG